MCSEGDREETQAAGLKFKDEMPVNRKEGGRERIAKYQIKEALTTHAAVVVPDESSLYATFAEKEKSGNHHSRKAR